MTSAGRDAFVLSARPRRPAHDPWRPHGIAVDQEPDGRGALVDAVTMFLTGRECPWRCVMCDLWRFTTVADTPRGAIPRQIDEALARLGPPCEGRARWLKLYNAGSFFDPHAVPDDDYAAVVARLGGFRRLVVESHPALVGARLDRLVSLVDARAQAEAPRVDLEVAMGLETTHPAALERLNKRMTVDQYLTAAARLADRGVALRAFVLIAPPFVPPDEQPYWLSHAIDTAFDAGASVVSLIPTRSGNGAMEQLERDGAFVPPALRAVEDAFDAALSRARGRVLLDVWDVGRLIECAECAESRHARLAAMNLSQRVTPRVRCDVCSELATDDSIVDLSSRAGRS